MVAKYRLSVAQYDRMIETGILTENDRVVLIRGELVPKMTIGGPHLRCVNILTMLFARRVSQSVVVSVQNPVVLADSEPEPDIVLLDAAYASRHDKPHPSDVHLLIEVADS